MPWGVPLTRSKGGRGACLGGVRVREGWPRRVLSGPRAYLHTYLLHARLHLVFEPRTKGGAWRGVATASGVSGEGHGPASLIPVAERSVTAVSRSTLTRPALAPPPPGNTGEHRLRSRWVNQRLQLLRTCAPGGVRDGWGPGLVLQGREMEYGAKQQAKHG